MNQLVQILDILLTILIFAIFGRALLSWFPIDRNGPVVQAINAITDPILNPLRRIVPMIGMVDITPMVAIFVLYILQRALQSGA